MGGLPNNGGMLVIGNQTLITHRRELTENFITAQPAGNSQPRAPAAESRAICAKSRAISDARVETMM